MHELRRALPFAGGLLAFAAFIACGDAGRQPLSPDGHGPRMTITTSTVTCPDTISQGQSAQCVAYFYDENHNLVTTTATWGTNTPALDSVSTTGVVRGLGVGLAEVHATAAGVTGSKNVYVKAGLTLSINGPTLARRWTTCTYTRSVSGGAAPYTYEWSDEAGGGSPINTGTSYSVDMISAGDDIYLTVTDANGWQRSATKHVTVTLSAPVC
jgi:hypothetical protein